MEYRSLEITLQHARDLPNVNFISKMDVYAVVSLSGGDQRPTRTPPDRDGGSNPTWDFPVTFHVDEAALRANRLALDFKLVCERALGDKDVGEVHVPVTELLHSPPTSAAAAGGKRFVSYQVRKPSGNPKGQLTFSYRFGEIAGAGAAVKPPYPAAPPPGKCDFEPVTAYPAVGPSSEYPPYTAAGAPPPGMYPPPPVGYGYPPAPGPSYAYPPVPGQGYGYPPPPGPGYGYPPPPPPGYGYPPAAAKKNKFGLGLGAGLLGGAIGGLLVGDMISDAAGFDCGFDF